MFSPSGPRVWARRQTVSTLAGPHDAPWRDRTIVLDMRRGRYRRFSGMGSRIWELLEHPARLNDIVERLEDEYDAPRARIGADVQAFLVDLERIGLVETRAIVAAPPAPAECILALAAARTLVKVAGLHRALAVLRAHSRGRPSLVNRDVVEQAVRAMRVAGALYPGRAECLERSMALCFVLRRRGLHARLHFGVDPFYFDGHAWVAHDGQLLDETRETLTTYVPLTDIEL
ncbi:lasso peptide biosynthesis B2 protein [Pendulispora rubella]|uniref:Lasso peptide biosynthesis B2 protein n=1 Tax=Pendulispora rubella TaxID=2741070 RepID=A0ABZ2KRW6_9BACT